MTIKTHHIGAMALALATAVAPGTSDGATLTPSSFRFDGGTLGLSVNGGKPTAVVGAWNPHGLARDQGGSTNAAHVSFFGRAAGCAANAVDGTAGPLTSAQISALQKEKPPLPLTSGLRVWSPVPDPSQCPAAAGAAPGPAFAAEADNGSGLRIFTAIGRPSGGADGSFLQQFDETGEGGSGNNKGVSGTFISWHFDRDHGSALRPWSQGGDRPVNVGIEIAVPAAQVEAPDDDRGINQAKQQVAISFFNNDCARTVAKPQLCQVRLMLVTDLVRQTQRTMPHRGMDAGHLMFDRQQGGLPVMIGPMMAAGEPTMTGGANAVEIWRSSGAATQHGTFDRKQFGAKIDFRDFIAILNLIADRAAAGGRDHADMASLFGPSWQNPLAWQLTAINVSQELHVAQPLQLNFMAGMVYRITVEH